MLSDSPLVDRGRVGIAGGLLCGWRNVGSLGVRRSGGVVVMGAIPYVPFYLDDWLGGTLLLDRRHKGAYLDLLILQVKNGPFTEAQALAYLGPDADTWETLKGKFAEDERGLYVNEKMASVVEKTLAYCQSRRTNGKKHMQTHMQSICKAHAKHTGYGSGSGSEDKEGESEGEKTTRAIITTISGVPIPWSMYGKVLKKYGDDHRRAQTAFYRGAKSGEPLTSEAAWWRWLQAGFNRERTPGGWLYEPCQDETDNREQVARWIDAHFPVVQVSTGKSTRQTKPLPQSIGELLPGIAGPTEGGAG